MAEDRKDAVEDRVNATVRESEDKRSRLEQELTRFDEQMRERIQLPAKPPPLGDLRQRGWR